MSDETESTSGSPDDPTELIPARRRVHPTRPQPTQPAVRDELAAFRAPARALDGAIEIVRRPIMLLGRTLVLALRVPQVSWSFLKVERRYIEFFPAVVVFPVVYGMIVLLDRTELSVDTYSSYFQTAAQVIVTLLVAIAIEVRNIAPGLLTKVRPALYLSVSLIALAAVAALVALSPWCPDWLVRHVFGVTTGGGLGAFVAVVVVNFRLLTGKSDKIESGGVLG